MTFRQYEITSINDTILFMLSVSIRLYFSYSKNFNPSVAIKLTVTYPVVKGTVK